MGQNAIDEANRLLNQANELASEKIVQFKSLIHETMKNYLVEQNNKGVQLGNGIVVVTSDVQSLLDGITDQILRQFVYLAYLKDSSLNGAALIEAGKKMMNSSYEDRLAEEKARIRAELEKERLDRDTIDKVMSKATGSAKEQIKILQESANNEIVGEKVRKKSLKIIMQAIEARGFIVDKKNIKIQRETNEVVMVALKASGEKAEFRVFMDGKFIYDFHGYQGQSCQKDIEPFMNDLEEVYGIHITA